MKAAKMFDSEGGKMDVEVDTDSFKVDAEGLVKKVKELIHESTVRRIIVKNDQGHTVMEVPVAIGVVGAIAAPVVAALGAMGALAARWTIDIERDPPKEPASDQQDPTPELPGGS